MNAIPRFFIHIAPYGASTDIFFGGYSDDGTQVIYTKPAEIICEKVESGFSAKGDTHEPMLSLTPHHSDESLQSLMDELWRIGVRPKDIGTAGHLAATRQHLADMRTLVEKAHGVTLPPLK